MKDESKITINITTESILKGILIILLFWFLFYIKDLVLVVLTAVVIASGLEPLINWFKKFRISRIPAAIISYVVLLGTLAGLAFFFIPNVLSEASQFLETVPKYLSGTALWNPLNIDSKNITESQKLINNLSETVNDPSGTLKNLAESEKNINSSFGIGDLIKTVREVSSSVEGSFVKVISTIFGGFLSFILVIVLSFYLLVQEDGVAKFLGLITPVKHEKYVVDLWKRSQRKIGQWMQGQLLLGILVAVLLYLGLMVLGIKNALLLAVLGGLLEIIPVFGPIIASIPAIMVGFVDGGLTTTLLVAGLYIIVQQFENHLIYPLVVRKIVGVSPIVVILALIIGAKLAGFLGIVLSVPIISALMELIEDIERKKNLFWQKADTQ